MGLGRRPATSWARVVAVGVIAALAAAACGRGPTESSADRAPAADGSDAPRGAQQQIDDILRSAPSPTAGALAAFAAVVGPVPGHEDQEPVVPLDDEWLFGDRVIKLVMEQLDELSVEEREAVRRALEGAPTQGGTRGRSARIGAGRSADQSQLQQVADEMVGVLAAAVGHRLSSTVTVRVVRSMIGDGFAATESTRQLLNTDADGVPLLGPGCVIQVGPRLAGASDAVLRSAMAHEVFHCIQDEVFGDSRSTPEWFHEGVAAWVGLAYGADVPFYGRWWRDYLLDDDWTLDGASYDALGMFATLQSSGVDVEGFVRAALDGGVPSDAALKSALDGVVSDSSVAQLGPSPARRPEWGRRWTTNGVGLSGTDARRAPQPILVGRGATIAPSGDGNIVRRVGFEQQGAVVITVDGTAFGAWRWGELTDELSGPVRGRYCGTDPCRCPDGTPVPGGPYADIPGGEMLVGLATSGTRRSDLEVAVTPITELCRPADPPRGDLHVRLSGPGGGTWTTGLGNAYCTAERTGGTWILSIGDVGGRTVSISLARPPTDAGPQPDANVFWSDGTTQYVNAPGMTLTFHRNLASGTFSGEALDPRQPDGDNAGISGSFDCGDGGQPPLGAAPWTGR